MATILSTSDNLFIVFCNLAKEIVHYLGPFSGTSTDWAYGTKGIPIVLCVELPSRDTPKLFELPEGMILRTSAELLDGFIGLIKAVKELGYI